MKKIFSSTSFKTKGEKETPITEYYTLDVEDATAYQKVNPKRKILSRWWCRLLIASIICFILISLLIFLIVLFSVGEYLWHVVFAVNPAVNCGPLSRENSPSNYTIQTKCPYFVEPSSQWHDKLSKYFVEKQNYKTVSFMSRDADWINGGIGKVKVIGTLLTQPIVNSTSKFIVVVHGYTACRYKYESMLAATMLYHMGFNVLQIDLRNHGDTGVFKRIPYVSFGSLEHLDVLGALDFLQTEFPFLGNNSFGIFGTSMGGATSLIAFTKDKRIKQAFVDSPPIDIFETIFDGAKQIVGESAAKFAFIALRSVVPIKAPLMGFPPFHNDVKTLLQSVDLSNDRKLFLMHVEGDLVVPTFNYYEFWKAVNTSIVNNNYSPSNVDSFLGQVDYPFNNRTRQYCSKHLAYQFLNLDHFHQMLFKFFSKML